MKRLLPLMLGSLLLGACNPPNPTPNAPLVTLTGSISSTLPGVVTLSATVKSDVAIKQVVFSRENKPLGTVSSPNSSGTYQFTDVLPASGKYRYHAVATDINGLNGEGLIDADIIIASGLSEVRGTLVESSGLSNAGLTTSAWTGGSGSLVATLGSSEVARTALGTDGTFVLPLPASVPSANLQAVQPALFGLSACTTTPSNNNPAALGAVAAMRAEATKTGAAQPLTITTTLAGGLPKIWTATSGLLVYLNQPAYLSGTTTCTLGSPYPASGSGPVTFNLVMVPGWNKVSRQLSISTSGDINLKLSSEPVDFNTWVYGAPQTLPPAP